MMIVYDYWREGHKAIQAHQDIKELDKVITSSNASAPKTFL